MRKKLNKINKQKGENMTNLKELAEILLKAHNSESNFNDVIAELNSSANTVKDDIKHLKEGGKTPVTFSVKRMLRKVESLEYELESARDSARQAEDAASEASGICDEAEYLLGDLKNMLETAKEEVKETNDEEDE